MNNIVFRKAEPTEYEESWATIAYGKKTMYDNGRHQWTEEYPSPELIRSDIENGMAYVLMADGHVAAYGVVVLNGEPEYENLHDGTWLTTGDYYVVHRMAVAENFRGRGMAKRFMSSIEDMCRRTSVPSIKVDTNYDNVEMLTMLPEMGYVRCGRIEYEVGGTRIAFEKKIDL